jgi:peptidyl-prolyl cis-trans isomerase A (cyclophilin A)
MTNHGRARVPGALLISILAIFGCPAASPDTGTPAPQPPGAAAPMPMNGAAPAVFKIKFATTKGDFVVEVTRAWAPNGADRIHELVTAGFYDRVKFFRAIAGFMVQFGINGDPQVNRRWAEARIPDDPVRESNRRGYMTFATSGPNSRTTQVFINLADNQRLDASGFSPFGKVISGLEVVDSLHTGYGEGAPGGAGPEQGRINAEGNAYLERFFPNLDAVMTASILP